MNQSSCCSTGGDTATKTAFDQASETAPVAEQVKEKARQAAHQAKETATEVAHEVKERAADAAGKLRRKGESLAAHQKDRIAEEVGRVGAAVRKAAESFCDANDDRMAGYAGFCADRVEESARYLKDRDVRQLTSDVESFARRHPELVLGGLFLGGMMIGRFLKASRPKDGTGRDARMQAFDDRYPMEREAYGHMYDEGYDADFDEEYDEYDENSGDEPSDDFESRSRFASGLDSTDETDARFEANERDRREGRRDGPIVQPRASNQSTPFQGSSMPGSSTMQGGESFSQARPDLVDPLAAKSSGAACATDPIVRPLDAANESSAEADSADTDFSPPNRPR